MNERTNFIIAYLADLSGVKKNLDNLQRLNSVIAKEFGDDFTKATKQIGDAVENISKKTIKIKGQPDQIQEIKTLTTTVKTADGQLRKLVETENRLDGALKSTNVAFKDASGSSKSFSQNLGELIKRAALTIPTWFLLRNAVRSVFVTIRDGFQSFVEFDNILQKAKRNLTGSAEQIESDFSRIKGGIEDLSRTTGESVVDIADAFQRFATLGFDAETSLAGATAATKLAVLQFDSLDNIANGLARTFKILSGSFKNNKTDGENLITTVALMDELWKENAFDANELIGALQRFAPTANRLNISLTDSVKLLATLQSAAVLNTRAGRLLGRSFDELAGNIGKVGKSLGIDVNPEAEGTVEIFLKVVRALESLRTEAGNSQLLNTALRQLFGGRIGIEAPAALAALRVQLEKNLRLTGNVANFNKELAKVTDTVSRQAKIAAELKVAFQRAFVEGLAGGTEGGIESLKSLNKFLIASADNLRLLGSVIRDDIKFLRDLATFAVPGGIGAFQLIREEDAKRELAKIEGLTGDINKALFGQLDFAGFADVLTRAIQSVQNNEGIISQNEVTQLERLFELLKKGEVIPLKFEPIDAKAVLANIEAQKIASENIKLLKADQKAITESIISDELEILRASGAQASEILKSKTALEDQLDLRRSGLEDAQRQLDIEKAIKDERRLQNNLSSESLKLFKIAQTEGTNVARQISEVLSGDQDFDLFERRGGRAFEVFKKQFGDIFESQQAERFFSGDRVGGLTGGANINTRESFGRNPASFNAQAQLAQNRAFATLDPSSQPQRPINQTNNVNITNNITSNNPDEIKKIVEKTIVDGFKNPQSSITLASRNIISGF